MSATWRDSARSAIEAAIAKLPPDADLQTRKKALRDAYPFGERKHFPYKVWCEEVKIALETGTTSGAPRKSERLEESEIMPAMRDWAREHGLVKKTKV